MGRESRSARAIGQREPVFPQVPKGNAPVNGAEIYYERVSTGRPIVFIPRKSADRRMWHDQVAACARQYEVIRYDLRGWGKSPRRRGIFRHAEDLAALLDWLGIERTALVGYWDAAEIALDLALTRPELVAALILVEPMVSGWRPRAQAEAFDAYLERFTAQAAQPNPVRRILGMAKESLAAAQLFGTGAQPPRTWRRRWARTRMNAIKGANLLRTLGMVYGWRPFDLRYLRFAEDVNRDQPGASYSACRRDPLTIDALEQMKVTAPTLIVRGLPTSTLFLELDEELHTRLADGAITLLADALHLPHMTRPDLFNEVMLEFLQRVYPSP